MLEGLQQQRSSLLGSLVDLHVGLGLLAGAEADRLAQKNGASDPRVQVLRDRSDTATARVNALSVEQEIAVVRTPAPPTTGALIQGRVTDVTQRAAGQVSVQLVDPKGQPVPGVGSVEADDSGYFAIQLSPDSVKAIGGNKVRLLVRSGNDQLVPAAAQPLTVAAGAVLTQGVTLSAAELAQLRLRVPVAVSPVTVRSQPGDAAPVVDTAAPGNSAADKAAADKAAADKATAAKAVGDKAAADEAATKKAAADEAAADKAAADKTGADKTAEAAADKPAAGKTRPSRTRGDKS
jgi:hypothetical protein